MGNSCSDDSNVDKNDHSLMKVKDDAVNGAKDKVIDVDYATKKAAIDAKYGVLEAKRDAYNTIGVSTNPFADGLEKASIVGGRAWEQTKAGVEYGWDKTKLQTDKQVDKISPGN